MVEPLFARRSRVVALALALASATAGAPALAQTSGEKAAAAQALFDEGMRLMQAGKPAEACPKLEESQRLDGGMGTQFRLAECHEKVGKVASAWAGFIAVAATAAAARQPERESAARQRAEALAPRLPRLTLTVPPEVEAIPGLVVMRDGGPVGKPLWTVPVPLDPGEHVVTAEAPGKKTWTTRVTAVEGAALGVTIGLLETAPGGTPPVVPPPQPRKRSAVPAIVLGGVAVAGVVVGGALFAVHGGKHADAGTLSASIAGGRGTCVPGAARFDMRCSTLTDDAKGADTFGNASTAMFVLGGAAAVGLITYLLLPSARPSSPSSGRGIQVFPVVGEGRGGLFAAGSF
jgi:hypothetical protein